MFTIDLTLQARRFFLDAYKRARWNNGHVSIEATESSIKHLHRLIEFYRSSPTQEEKQRRVNFFGLSVAEIEIAIGRAEAYREAVVRGGGNRVQFEKVSAIWNEIEKSKDRADKAALHAKRTAKFGKTGGHVGRFK